MILKKTSKIKCTYVSSGCSLGRLGTLQRARPVHGYSLIYKSWYRRSSQTIYSYPSRYTVLRKCSEFARLEWYCQHFLEMSLLVWHCSDPNIVLYKNNTHLEMMSCAKLQTKTDSLECAKFTHIKFVFHNLMFLNYKWRES